MALSDREIKTAREKLRKQYDTLAAKYGSNIFSWTRVDERYMQSLKQRLPAEHFLANEVRILKELEKKAEEMFAPPPEVLPTNADRMLEEFAERIQAYPRMEFSDRADEETQRLAGALSAFYERWGQILPGARSLPPGTDAARLAHTAWERIFHQLEPVRAGAPPRILADLALSLGRITVGERERERFCKEYLKESGFLCNLISDLLGALLAAEAKLPGEAAGPREEARAEMDAIIYAFRLREFRLASPE
ncbi:MAG: hypothetical protein LBC99_00570 [Spirochaetota bacterium]|jgi:hypothetical protein|nr:hypothetical protein [Spirochaetota bacterium]